MPDWHLSCLRATVRVTESAGNHKGGSMRQLSAVLVAGVLAAAGFAPGVMPSAHAVAVVVEAHLDDLIDQDTASDSGPGYTRSADARAEAGYGFGKLVANASVVWDIQSGQSAGGIGASATARASFIDTLTIDSMVAPAGDNGVLWFDVLLTFDVAFMEEVRGTNVSNAGTVSFPTYWDTFFGGSLRTVGGYCHIYLGNWSDTGLFCGNLDVVEVAPGSYEARARYGLDFIFGQAFELGMRTEAVLQTGVGLQAADSGGSASMLFDAGNSIYWDGIADVTWNGESVPYTIRSASGSNYRSSFAPTAQPVPEPSTLLLLLAATLALTVMRGARGPRPDPSVAAAAYA